MIWVFLILVGYVLPILIGVDILRAGILSSRNSKSPVTIGDVIKCLFLYIIPILNWAVVFALLTEPDENINKHSIIMKYWNKPI